LTLSFAQQLVPRPQDRRALGIKWARSRARSATGTRMWPAARRCPARYVGLIVSPSESMGWMCPIFSAWTVRRVGSPSLPVCEPALDGEALRNLNSW